MCFLQLQRRNGGKQSIGSLGDQLGDLSGLRKTPRLILGEDQPAVHLDIKDAIAAFDQFGFDALLLQFIRHTGGIGPIVSHHAEVYGGLSHGSSFADSPTRVNTVPEASQGQVRALGIRASLALPVRGWVVVVAVVRREPRAPVG